MIKLERLIIQSKPITFIRESSKEFTLPGFQGLCLYDVFHAFWRQLQMEALNVRAAAISFNLVMAVPAATIFICTLIPYMPGSEQIYRQLMQFVSDVTPNKETRTFMVQFINDFFNKPGTGLLSLGFLLALFYSSNAMMGIIRTFDSSLIEKRKTNFIKKRLRAVSLIIIVISFIIGTILITLGQGMLFKNIMNWLNIHNESLQWWIKNFRWVLIFLLFVYSIAIIYKYAPSYKVRGRLHTPGAFLAAILIILTTTVFSYWAQNISNYNKFYGPIGTILILMLLIFLNSLMLLIGFELNVSIAHLRKEKTGDKSKPADVL
ncbi:MAG: YihY/virulence factor BrkB family protein [Ilyomonas sp.]